MIPVRSAGIPASPRVQKDRITSWTASWITWVAFILLNRSSQRKKETFLIIVPLSRREGFCSIPSGMFTQYQHPENRRTLPKVKNTYSRQYYETSCLNTLCVCVFRDKSCFWYEVSVLSFLYSKCIYKVPIPGDSFTLNTKIQIK